MQNPYVSNRWPRVTGRKYSAKLSSSRFRVLPARRFSPRLTSALGQNQPTVRAEIEPGYYSLRQLDAFLPTITIINPSPTTTILGMYERVVETTL